jgi:hypothetical protein
MRPGANWLILRSPGPGNAVPFRRVHAWDDMGRRPGSDIRDHFKVRR